MPDSFCAAKLSKNSNRWNFQKKQLAAEKDPLQAVFMHIVSDATDRVFPTKLSRIVWLYSPAGNMLLVFCNSTESRSYIEKGSRKLHGSLSLTYLLFH